MSKFKIIFCKKILQFPKFLLPSLISWISFPLLSYQFQGFYMVLHNLVYYFSFHGKITFINRSYCIDKKNIYFYRQQVHNLNALSEWGNTISGNNIVFISFNFIHPEIRCLFRGNCLASLCCHCSQKGSGRNLQAVKICLDKSTAWKILVKLNKRD